jgi:pilus assembly protein CpaE
VTETVLISQPERSNRRQAVEVWAGRNAGRVISVISPKGGQGKTTVASNLAIGLARTAPGGVVLIDADAQFGDVEAVFALTPAHTLPDIIAGSATGDSLVLKALLTPHPSGIFVVCAAASPADGDAVTGEQLGGLIRHLASIFRYVVIDTTPGLGEHALTAIEFSTDAIVVASPSVSTLLAVRKALALLKAVNLVPHTLHLVLNLADSAVGLDQRSVVALAGAPVSVTIPRSSIIALATNRGTPILAEGSRDPAAKAFGHLVAKVSGVPYSSGTRSAQKQGRK